MECVKNEVSQILWEYYISGGYKNMRYDNCVSYEQLMKHDRRHKKSFASRENVSAITDYECTKIPLNDFQRGYNPHYESMPQFKHVAYQ